MVRLRPFIVVLAGLVVGCPAEPEPIPAPRSAPTVRPDPIPLHGEAAPGRPAPVATPTEALPKDGR